MRNALLEAAESMRDILRREAAAARQASLAELAAIHEEKQEALGLLAMLDPARDMPAAEAEPTRAAIRAMLAAAEENAMVLASVAGGLEAVQERLRAELAAEANPGTYALAGKARQKPHSLAASIDQSA